MMLGAMVTHAALHGAVLKVHALFAWVDGHGIDVDEGKNGLGHTVAIYLGVIGERWIGAVIVYIEAADAMMVIVMGEELA